MPGSEDLPDRNHARSFEVLPEAAWCGLFIALAANLATSEWTALENILEYVMLAAVMCWSLIWRVREGPKEVFYSLLYMAATIGIIAIQNSSWTRLAIIILMLAWFWGRNYRSKNQERYGHHGIARSA